MPACARREIVADSEVGVYHCVARCVRRAYLCGDDPFSGKNFDHRKVWLLDRLEELAGVFAVEVLSFSIMSNHIHLLLRTRPDVAAEWSDDEVARRWCGFSYRGRGDREPFEADPRKVTMLRADAERLQERRGRLASLSWFMACVCEPLARRANREDRCTGRFWEGRFKCVAVLDEPTLLTSSIYVDLNPIRAALAETPETSTFTSAYERIAARQQAAQENVTRGTDAAGVEDVASAPVSERSRDGWLSPVPDADGSRGVTVVSVDAKSTLPVEEASVRRRASDRGFLPMLLDEYLQLLDWTGRQVRSDKRGSIPQDLLPILTRLRLNEQTWLDSVLNFGRWFHRAVGRSSSMAARAGRAGKRWFQGLSHCRLAFG